MVLPCVLVPYESFHLSQGSSREVTSERATAAGMTGISIYYGRYTVVDVAVVLHFPVHKAPLALYVFPSSSGAALDSQGRQKQ